MERYAFIYASLTHSPSAVEYKNWVLYFFRPVMKGILPEPYYTHFMLYVEACRWLYSQNVTEDHIKECDKVLKTFVEETQKFYGVENMDFCVHSNLHLPKYVRLFGPLWVTSNFQFEGLLKTIKYNLHGTTNYDTQFVRILKTIKYLSKLENTLENVPLDNKSRMLFRRFKSSLGYNDEVRDFDFHQKKKVTGAPATRVLTFLNLTQDSRSVYKCQKITADNLSIRTKESATTKTDSSWISYTKNDEQGDSLKFGRVLSIYSVENGNVDDRAIIIEAAIVEKHRDPRSQLQYFGEETAGSEFVHLEQIASVLIPVRVDGRQYLSYPVKYF
jgi:hypothetical protein